MTLQKKATLVSSFVATLLVIIKLVVSILSGSVSILASAVDSMLDLVVSLFNYFAVVNSEKPADENFNYGRGKIEALAAVIEGTIITISGLFILYQSIKKLISGESISYLGESIWVMVISFIVTLALVLFLEMVAKRTKSMVIKSDALHYKTDLFSNGAILFSLIAVNLTGFEYLDSIVAIFIAFYIIYSAYGLIKEGVLVLLDISLPKEIVDKIEIAINSHSEIDSFHDLRTREAGNSKFVDVHLVFNQDTSLIKAHSVSDDIDSEIRKVDIDSHWIINVHFDTFDDSDIN
jgi:cation diffusion facilitator family transporter